MDLTLIPYGLSETATSVLVGCVRNLEIDVATDECHGQATGVLQELEFDVAAAAELCSVSTGGQLHRRALATCSFVRRSTLTAARKRRLPTCGGVRHLMQLPN